MPEEGRREPGEPKGPEEGPEEGQRRARGVPRGRKKVPTSADRAPYRHSRKQGAHTESLVRAKPSQGGRKTGPRARKDSPEAIPKRSKTRREGTGRALQNRVPVQRARPEQSQAEEATRQTQEAARQAQEATRTAKKLPQRGAISAERAPYRHSEK